MFPRQVVDAFMKAATGRVESSSGMVLSVSTTVSVMVHQGLSTVLHHLVKSRKYAVSLRENMAAILNPVPHALPQGTPTTSRSMDTDLISRAHADIHWQLYVMILWGYHIFKSPHKMKHGTDSQCQSLLKFMSMFQDIWFMFPATWQAQQR